MKKMNKLVLSERVLLKQEIEQLKGGAYTDEILNKNVASTCVCTYNNSTSLTNRNETIGCSCTCSK